MADEMSYPGADMRATAASMRSLLESTWSQHAQLVSKSLLEPAAQLGNRVAGPFSTDVQHWDQQMQACYQALHELAASLDTGATIMGQEDQNVAQGFQREDH